jgi:hypothetical protein
MIPAKELNIGNLVIWNPKLSNPDSTLSAMFVEVSEVLNDRISYVFPNIENRVEPFEDDVAQAGVRSKPLKELEPVILTEEILENSGFVKKGGLLTSKHFEKGKLELKQVDEHFEIPSIKNSPAIKSVHQLQNISFALTGEEVEIRPHGQQA